MKQGTVGHMRQQSALVDADTPIILVTKNEALKVLIKNVKVVRVYPDTTDAEGNWTGTFKVEVDEES